MNYDYDHDAVCLTKNKQFLFASFFNKTISSFLVSLREGWCQVDCPGVGLNGFPVVYFHSLKQKSWATWRPKRFMLCKRMLERFLRSWRMLKSRKKLQFQFSSFDFSITFSRSWIWPFPYNLLVFSKCLNVDLPIQFKHGVYLLDILFKINSRIFVQDNQN